MSFSDFSKNIRFKGVDKTTIIREYNRHMGYNIPIKSNNNSSGNKKINDCNCTYVTTEYVTCSYVV